MRRALFYLFTNLIMTFIELPFEYTNGLELLCGYFITTLILALINYIFYHIAYSIVGWHAALTDSNSAEMSRLHWFIRFILASILYALTYLPAVSRLLTYLIHLFYIFIKEQYCELMQKLSDYLLSL